MPKVKKRLETVSATMHNVSDMSDTPQKKTRHGVLADNMTRITVILPRSVKDVLAKRASRQGRSVSNMIRHECTILAQSPAPGEVLPMAASRPARRAKIKVG